MRSDESVHDAAGEEHPLPGSARAPWQLEVEVGDDALLPVLQEGQTAVVDCSDHVLEGGGIYAVRDGERLDLWLYQPGFAGLGCRFDGRSIGTLMALGGQFRLRGPLPLEAIRLVGRVVEPGPERPGALAELREQQARLVGLRETTRAALLQRTTSDAANGAWCTATSIEAVAEGLARSLRNQSFADRFALEQRLDAVDARLALLDELIAALPARGLADALTKLETLAALEEAGGDDLPSRLLRSAITALERVANEGRRPGREGSAAGTAEPSPVDAPAEPLELVASPRHRRQ